MTKFIYKIKRNYYLIIATFKSKGFIGAIKKFFNLIISQFKKYYYRNLFKFKKIQIIDSPFEIIEVPVDLINYKLNNTPPHNTSQTIP